MTKEEGAKGLTLRGATFLGIGAMVGAGIFTLLGEAGAVAGSAVWISFLLGGIIAGLMGYTVAKLGTRYPASGGLITFFVKGYGDGHRAGVAAWLMYFSMLIVIAMVAVTFGTYAGDLLLDDPSQLEIKLFAAALIIALGAINISGSDVVNRVQSVIVIIELIVFTGFIIVTWRDMDPELLRPATYPETRYIISSVGLTFFAYLGFAVISYTAADMPNPERNVPRATYRALVITTILYVLISIGVFGVLTVDQVVGYGSTALAEAVRPSLGEAGFAIMAVAAMIATSAATNSNIYAVKNVTQKLTEMKQFPPALGRPSPLKGSWGMIASLAAMIVMASVFDLSAIASIGSMVALTLFLVLGIAAFGLRTETGSNVFIVLLAVVADAGVLLIFVADTLDNNPRTFVSMLVIAGLAIVLELIMSRQRGTAVPVSPEAA